MPYFNDPHYPKLGKAKPPCKRPLCCNCINSSFKTRAFIFLFAYHKIYLEYLGELKDHEVIMNTNIHNKAKLSLEATKTLNLTTLFHLLKAEHLHSEIYNCFVNHVTEENYEKSNKY